ncbi:hypothetical protein FC70_GL001075 [Paucilactobacillus oligofermentans DSM 15707 = LMG 22743]|uniref:N-acetyltransferase domain-containing protein n=1 Tax=Paucilactobacillus oligofermentans DSM 15707 = LMG 22743 TaxID=1423778 RepID=A0A0R1RFB3_9LACO|nr:GNAT family N-acetyltransferase [Paucilactobacillus oligofermentans]KRL55478.1 hypothetical protein FC70_GL001075 [Paucilactobacillus oligofermentans DSM 15707 = LMG 22743]CUS25537.1 N-Acyltransferase superfamily protein [Paucilactobacillus oligofermentans DSM 15707 = LMG 22743]
MIYDEMELEEFESIPEADPQRLIKQSFSHRSILDMVATTLVAVEDGNVIGVAFGYPNTNEDAVNRVFLDVAQKIPSINTAELFTDQEAVSDEFYLDSLAVDEDYRGYGVATKLIDEMAAHANDLEYETLGLNVDLANPKAERLYRRLGFVEESKIMIGDHQYRHMQVDSDTEMLV